MKDTYTHGHHASVLRSHEWRTAENSAGYLLDRLRPGQRLLDVGCGPGTITVDLARRVAPGRVLGVDTSAEVIERADSQAVAEVAAPPGTVPPVTAPPGAGPARTVDVGFAVGDVYALDEPDGCFDVVHAHQVLQHLTDPVAALRELRRVLAPGGTLAVRDADYGGFTWAPLDARLTRWNELYHQVTARNGAEADAGRHLPAWVRAAGFSDPVVSTSTWTFADAGSRVRWGSLWAERVQRSSFALQAVEYGLADHDELAALAAAWRSWAEEPDGFFLVPHTEVLAVPCTTSWPVRRRAEAGEGYAAAVTGPEDPRWPAVVAALGRAGSDPEVEPVVVRDGAALLVRSSSVLVRVRPAPAGIDVARREVDLAALLCDHGVAVTPLAAPAGQPWEIEGSVVTAWHWVDAVASATPTQLGELARSLRDRTATAATGAALCEPIEAILSAVAHVPDGDRDGDFVRRRVEELAPQWADAAGDDPFGRAIVHGDLHAGNVIVGSDGPMLTDLELSGSGPASYDAAPAVVAVTRYGAAPASLEAFVAALGTDPRPWPGLATFVAVYELWGAAWAVGVRHLDPRWASEATRRVESLRDGADHRWSLS